MITYSTAELAPATIFIPAEKWTKELEKELIRKDIERRKKIKPEIIRI